MAVAKRRDRSWGRRACAGIGLALVLASIGCLPGARAQLATIGPDEAPTRERAQEMLQARVSNLYPGSSSIDVPIANPLGSDPAVIENGRRDFLQFNCVGCHASNGGGGIGPSLSDNEWIYGSQPANIYLSIVHGRPNGMPAWGGMFPDEVVWELVAYVGSIANAPDAKLGRTISRQDLASWKEQIPAEMIGTIDPWDHTEPFSAGQRPRAQTGRR